MHPNATEKMIHLLNYVAHRIRVEKVLDVGSLDENGCYRPIVEERGWKYIGIDIRRGPNVDIIVEPYKYPFKDNSFELVISGQTLEHVQAPWLWAKELYRITTKGGYVAIIAPYLFLQHRFPVDCWRILPDGAIYLLKDWAGFEEAYAEISDNDTWMWGKK